MEAIVLALGASLTWGLADFFGPLQGRVLGTVRTLVYVQVGGLVGIALIVAVRGKGPDGAAALLAIPAAISGTLGLFAYYRGIAVGVFFAAREPGRVGTRFAAGVGLAMLAAVGFGGYFPFMHAAGNADFWWASFLFRITSTSVILTAVAVRRPALGVQPSRLALLALIGFGDMFGNLLFAA